MTIQLHTKRDFVLDELAKTTSYVGAKKLDDETSYDRISMSDEDSLMFLRFWDEAKSDVTTALEEFLISSSDDNGQLTLSLSLPDNFNVSVSHAMNDTLFAFFVASMLSKWYAITNKDEAEVSAQMALALLQQLSKYSLMRIRPSRPLNS